jgi:hypothetical protein
LHVSPFVLTWNLYMGVPGLQGTDTSNIIVIFDMPYHDVNSFMCSAHKVTVLGVLHLILLLVA